VTRIYTSLAVIDIENKRFVLREKLAGMSVDELQAMTGAELVIAGDVVDMNVPEI